MRQFLARLRHRVWPEVRQTGEFWLSLGVPIASVLAAVVVGRATGSTAADQVRYFGTLLQFAGIVLVAQGVRELRRDFNRPTVLAAMRSRVIAIVQAFRPRNITLKADAGAIGISGGVATLTVKRTRDTIDQRVEALERDLEELRTQVQERDRTIDSSLSSLRADLSKERSERTEAHTAIAQKLDNVAVGGLYLDVIGLWWLLFATVTTCVPDELIRIGRFVAAYFS